MTWDESKHHRDPASGQFTHGSISAWAKKIDDRLREAGATGDPATARYIQSIRHTPPGHAEAAREHHRLWNIPHPPERGGLGRERTDAEHAEAVRLDDAFEAYREMLGLRRNPKDRGLKMTYVNSERQIFNQYGERLNGRYTHNWSESMAHKDTRQSRRRGETRTRPDEGWAPERMVTQRFPDTGDSVTRSGEFGYGAHTDSRASDDGSAQLFVAAMKRQRARARMEMPREKVRRTPRGTKVENWMRG